MLYVTIPVFQSFSPKDLDFLTATAIFLIATSMNLMFECQFLLIHLSYYTHRRNVLEMPLLLLPFEFLKKEFSIFKLLIFAASMYIFL